MAIGNIPTVASLNGQAAQLAMVLRTNSAQILSLQAYVVTLGHSGLMTLGFADADATSLATMCNYMATCAQVYQGTATQGSMFNFGSALAALTGPF